MTSVFLVDTAFSVEIRSLIPSWMYITSATKCTRSINPTTGNLVPVGSRNIQSTFERMTKKLWHHATCPCFTNCRETSVRNHPIAGLWCSPQATTTSKGGDSGAASLPHQCSAIVTATPVQNVLLYCTCILHRLALVHTQRPMKTAAQAWVLCHNAARLKAPLGNAGQEARIFRLAINQSAHH